MAKTKRKPDDKEQSKRFIEKAEEMADENATDKFERAFKSIIPNKNNQPKDRA